MAGLRERQKEDRQRRIADTAKVMFLTDGFDNTTIEGIAKAAGLSGVTVHNYFGTKAGILLALVVENDRALTKRLASKLSKSNPDLVEISVLFSKIIMEHALQNLQKSIWRHVIATVTANSDRSISKPYFDLDQKLANVLIQQVQRLQDEGVLASSIDAEHLGKALFHLQNARFIQFVCSDDLQVDDVLQRLRDDLVAMFSVQMAPPA